MPLLLYATYIFWLTEAKCKFFNKVYTVHFIFLSTVSIRLYARNKMFCTFYICYVHLDLEILNTIRKKNAKKIKFLLTVQTKTNVYFVTCICTLTASNDIFQRVFLVLQELFYRPEPSLRPAPPPLKPLHFLKNRTRFRSASTRSSLKKSSSARPSPCGPARPAGQNSWIAQLCCGNSSVLFKELCRQLSSFQRTVGTVLKIGTDLEPF